MLRELKGNVTITNRFYFMNCHFNMKEIKTPYVVKIYSSFKSENNLKYWSFIRLSVATDKPEKKVKLFP